MIETKTNLTIAEIDDIYQSMSATELWHLNSDKEPIEINYTQEEIEKSERIYDIMDATDLEYEDIEKILFAPKKASLGVIQTYCKALDINIVDFIERALG